MFAKFVVVEGKDAFISSVEFLKYVFRGTAKRQLLATQTGSCSSDKVGYYHLRLPEIYQG